MFRAVVLLAMLPGCHLVFGADVVETPAVCGPYGEPTEVVFDLQLMDRKELSVDTSGVTGMVYANFEGAPVRKTRPHAIRLEDGVWVPDVMRNVGLDSLAGGVAITPTVAFGWLDPPIQIYEYRFVAGAGTWTQQVDIIDSDTFDHKRVGNLVEIDINGPSPQRLLVEARTTAPGARSSLQIRAFDSTWRTTDRLEAIAQDTDIDASSGVLTANADRLVYAAKVGDDPVSHLYASEVEADTTSFAPGERLQILGNGATEHVTEPWINADCTVIYFNRDGVIYTASQRLDEEGSGQ